MIFMHSAIMVDNPHPFFVAGFRTIMGAAFLFSMHAFTGKSLSLRGINKHQFIKLCLHGIILYTFSLSGFAAGMQYIDGVTACFILSTAPFITAFILYIKDKETLSIKKSIGLLIGFLALIPIILVQNESEAMHHITADQVHWGQLIFFGANVCYAYGWILAKDLLKVASEFSPSLLNAYAMFIGGVCSSIVYISIYHAYIPPAVTHDFWYLLVIFTIATIINYNLYAYLLRFYSATFLSFAGFLEPVFGLLLASILHHKEVTIPLYAALALLSLGLYVFYQEELKVMMKNKSL